MKNYKKIRWIEEPVDQLNEKFGGLSPTSLKEDKIMNNAPKEILKILY